MHDLDWTVQDIFNHYSVHLSHVDEEERLTRAQRSHKNYQRTKDFCRVNNIPIMSQKTYDGIPGWEFPLEKIIAKYDCDLFTSGPSYAIAYAIFKKAKFIDLYGINCVKDEEWSNLRECIMAWLGIAKGAGVKITVTGMEFRPFRAYDKRLYGYNTRQKVRGAPQIDVIQNLETGQVVKYAVWREI